MPPPARGYLRSEWPCAEGQAGVAGAALARDEKGGAATLASGGMAGARASGGEEGGIGRKVG